MPLIVPNLWNDYPTDWSKYQNNHLSYHLPHQIMRPTETFRWGAWYKAAAEQLRH